MWVVVGDGGLFALFGIEGFFDVFEDVGHGGWLDVLDAVCRWGMLSREVKVTSSIAFMVCIKEKRICCKVNGSAMAGQKQQGDERTQMVLEDMTS